MEPNSPTFVSRDGIIGHRVGDELEMLEILGCSYLSIVGSGESNHGRD